MFTQLQRQTVTDCFSHKQQGLILTGRAIQAVETKVQNGKKKIKEIRNKMTSHTCTCVLYNQNNLILSDKNNKDKLHCKCGGIGRNEIW